MPSIGLLHFSDLHQGMEPLGWLWPNVREQLFLDLERLHKLSGPWDVVLFTGDLTQRGSATEFAKLQETLNSLWAHLQSLGSNPALLTIPGNHDLVRPRQTSTLRALKAWECAEKQRQIFWKERARAPRSVELVRTAFAAYTKWSAGARTMGNAAALQRFSAGYLPGDFSVTIEKEGLCLGIVGLNSAFLQLDGDDYHGRLDLDPRQLHRACGGDGVTWATQHDACLLLTHHPPDWLSPRAQRALRAEIAIPGRFVAHLFGHMHEHGLESISQGGFPSRNFIQAASLFGLETFGNEQRRSHGYGALRIEIADAQGRLLLFPRVAQESAAGHQIIVPNTRHNLIDERVVLPFNPRPRVVSGARESGMPAELAAAITAYRRRLIAVGGPWRVFPSLAAVIGRSRRNIALDFDSMYVPLRVKESLAAEREPDSLDLAQQAARKIADPPFDPEDLLNLAKAHRREDPPFGPEDLPRQSAPIVIRGPAGSGKSTWIEAAFRELLRDERALPIRIPLRELARRWFGEAADGAARSLDHYIEGWLQEFVPELRAFTLAKLLKNLGPVRPILLLDGWDETGPLGDEIRAKLLGFLRCHPRVLAVVTSRPYGECLPTHSDGFATFQILPLNTDEIQEIARRYWLFVEGHSEDEAARRAEAFVSHRLESLTGTPLFLLMALLARTGEVPASRWELHSSYLEYLLSVQADARGGVAELHAVEQWRPDNPEERLRAVAALAFFGQTWSKPPDLATAAERLPEGFPATSHAGMSKQRMRRGFIAWLAGPASLLVERMDGRFEFAHRSLQEWLAAWHLGSGDCSIADRLQHFESSRHDCDSWWLLRGAADLGCRRDPAWLDPIVEKFFAKDDEALGFLGALFVGGAGRDSDFHKWADAFIDALAQYCDEPINACVIEWSRDADAERRRYLIAQLAARAPSCTTQVYRRLNDAHRGWMHKPLPPPVQGTALHFLTAFKDGCTTAGALAVGRVLCGGSALWPGKPTELALLNLWPSYRRVVGQRLQLAAFCGADRDDLLRCAAQWLIPPTWDAATRQLVTACAENWRDMSGRVRKLSMKLDIDFNDDAAASPWLQHLVERWAWASGEAPHIMDVQSWSPTDNDQWTGFWAADWLMHLDFLDKKASPDDGSSCLAEYRAQSLGKLWLIQWTRYWAIIEGRFSPIRRMSWYLAMPLARTWALDLAKRLQLSSSCAWIDDFVWLDLMSVGRDTARAMLALEQPKEARWALLAEASRLSIGMSTESAVLQKRLKARFKDPLWPALARHLVGGATAEDRARLEALARDADGRDGALRWGFQYIVRGDILLNDGSLLTLDELADALKLPRLPLLEPPQLQPSC